MSNGTYHIERQSYQAIQYLSEPVEALQSAPAGLPLPVPAHPVRSCPTRSRAMNLARSDVLDAAQKPASPATHE